MSCSYMPPPVSRPLPPGDLSQVEQEEECCKPDVVWSKPCSYKVWKHKTPDSAFEYVQLTGSSAALGLSPHDHPPPVSAAQHPM